MDCIREMSLNSYSIDASFPKVSYFTNALLDTFGNEKFPKRDLTNMTNKESTFKYSALEISIQNS